MRDQINARAFRSNNGPAVCMNYVHICLIPLGEVVHACASKWPVPVPALHDTYTWVTFSDLHQPVLASRLRVISEKSSNVQN